MSLPSSGPISLSQVNVELGLSATAQISMNDAAVRTLFGRPSGAISMSDGYGKANAFSFTIASNTTNANLRTLAVNAGWNQTIKVIATINSGVFVSSNSTGTPALTVNGSFPGGVELINNGFIVGMGGNGGAGSGYIAEGAVAGSGGSGGGLALSVSSAITIRNNNTIAGGGGGGGGGRGGITQDGGGEYDTSHVGGGGGGGGRSSAAANSAGGAGGVATGGLLANAPGSPGGAGTSSSQGTGGAGGSRPGGGGGVGGNGGDWGAGGATGGTNTVRTSAGGPYAGGGGGAAISGNSNITYLATGTRLGAIT